MMKYHRLKINKNLSLTEIQEDDLESLTHHINDEVIYDNTLVVPHPYTREDAVRFVAEVRNFEQQSDQQKDWAIRYKDEMVGGIGLLYNYGTDSHRTEIGYWLTENLRNRGIMTKVLKSFSRMCFRKLRLSRLEAQVFEENIPSQKALEKAGFEREGVLRNAQIKDGKFKNTVLFSNLK